MTISLISIYTNFIFSQPPSPEVKIDGRLNINIDTNSIMIGKNAGLNLDFSSIGRNTFVGYYCGESNQTGSTNSLFGFETGTNVTTGSENSFFGSRSGYFLNTGWNNCFMGVASGWYSTSASNNVLIGNNAGLWIGRSSQNTIIGTSAGTANNLGSNNVFIGFTSGQDNDGSNNVFIGFKSGRYQLGSNQLIIENSDSTNPLILGDFEKNILKINGHLKISDFIRLTPISEAPNTPEKGTIYFDNNDLKVKVWTGIEWEVLN